MSAVLRHNSVFGPVTDPATELMMCRDERRRQRRAIRLLAEIDKRWPDLPVLDWLVTEWSLVGEAKQHDMRDRQRAFEAWVDVLRLTKHRVAGPSEDGTVHLRASASAFLGSDVPVSVVADIEERP